MSIALSEPFGDYELVERLGTGGMADTFVALRRGAGGFEQRVCLKRILPRSLATRSSSISSCAKHDASPPPRSRRGARRGDRVPRCTRELSDQDHLEIPAKQRGTCFRVFRGVWEKLWKLGSARRRHDVCGSGPPAASVHRHRAIEHRAAQPRGGTESAPRALRRSRSRSRSPGWVVCSCAPCGSPP